MTTSNQGGVSSNDDDPALDGQYSDIFSRCKSYSGAGEKGLVEMRRLVKASPDAPWVRRIRLNDAILADQIVVLRYLLDEIKVETLNASIGGYYPLQLAVIWGRIHIIVFLLSRGADPRLDSACSVVDQAKLRQHRLQDAFEKAGDGAEFEGVMITKSQIRELIDTGTEMLEILQGVEAHGSYISWAQHNCFHPLVRRFSRDIRSSKPRYDSALLRALVLSGRASLRSTEERSALREADAAKKAEQAKLQTALDEVLLAAGFTADASKSISGHLRLKTYKDLLAAELSQDQIEKDLDSLIRSRRITEGEQRKFQRFVRELDEAPAQPAAASSSGGYKSTAKAKAKSGAAPKAKAALMAMAAKAPTKAAPAKKAEAKPKIKGGIDPIAVLLSVDLPDSAFMNVVRFVYGV